MKENYIISLQMIKYTCIKSEKEYNKLLKEDDQLLSSQTLKYISGKKSFKEVIELAEEVV